MAIPSTWKSKDLVPEWALPHVEEKDGEFVLDVAGYRPKKEVDEFRENNLKLTQKLEELQAKMAEGLSPEEKTKLETEIQTLREKLEAGEHGEKIEELIAQRMTELEVGGRKVKVPKTDAPHLQSQLKALNENATTLASTAETMRAELMKERIGGATLAAMRKIGGFNPRAEDDVVGHVSLRFQMGDDLEAFLPDPDDKEGKTASVGADGKKLTIEGYLRNIVESGEKAGVWVDPPQGARQRIKAGSVPEAERAAPTGSRRIAKGLRSNNLGTA
jgi:hypothetical protein